MVNRFFMRLLIVGAAVGLSLSGAMADEIVPTSTWDMFRGTVTINGQLAPPGTIINAYDPDTVNCGRDTTFDFGLFGYFAVYGDDSNTPLVDEGAQSGNLISFRVLGLPATVDSGDAIWMDKDTSRVFLSVTGATVGLVLADAPQDTTGEPRDTIRFAVGVQNTGNIRDFYHIAVDQSKVPAWEIIYPSEFIYNEPDSIAYIWFDVVVADFPGDPPINNLTYTISSKVDTSAKVTGTVSLDGEPVSAEDPDDLLPGAFALYQNYPNPFNPSTTIAFTLPRTSAVRLEIYNTLGRQIDVLDLGSYSVGDHSVVYDGSQLSSGVYFYRIVTDYGAESRKMVLMK